MKTRYLLLLFAILSISGCKNELDLNSEYSQSLVIYGILNLKDSMQYVRVQKSYYSEDNGIYAGRFIDSICPKPEDIEIYMEVLMDYEFFDQFWKEDGRVKRFLYKEKYQENEYLRYVDYKPFYDHKNVGDVLITDSIGCQFSDSYLQFLAKHIPAKQGVVREVVGVDHIVTFPDNNMVFYLYNCNTPDLFHYLKLYSNIANGQGLFASRYFLTFFAQKLYPATIDSIAHGRYTGHLGFKGYYDPKKTEEYMNKY